MSPAQPSPKQYVRVLAEKLRLAKSAPDQHRAVTDLLECLKQTAIVLDDAGVTGKHLKPTIAKTISYPTAVVLMRFMGISPIVRRKSDRVLLNDSPVDEGIILPALEVMLAGMAGSWSKSREAGTTDRRDVPLKRAINQVRLRIMIIRSGGSGAETLLDEMALDSLPTRTESTAANMAEQRARLKQKIEAIDPEVMATPQWAGMMSILIYRDHIFGHSGPYSLGSEELKSFNTVATRKRRSTREMKFARKYGMTAKDLSSLTPEQLDDPELVKAMEEGEAKRNRSDISKLKRFDYYQLISAQQKAGEILAINETTKAEILVELKGRISSALKSESGT